MRALVLEGPNDFNVLDTYPQPKAKPGWAVVKVAFCGICGSDLPRFFETGSYHAHMVLGHESSGIVYEVTKDSKLKVGTPVAVLPIIPCGTCDGCKTYNEPFHCRNYQFIGSRNDGCMAEYVLVPESNLFVLKSDSEKDLMSGAFVEPASVGLHAVRRSGCKSGKALVFGCGAIGLMIASWLKLFGLKVTVVDVREFSLNIAKKQGFDNYYMFSELPDEKYDYIFEASGSNVVLEKAVSLAQEKSTITLIGRSQKDTVIPSKLMERFMRGECNLLGCWGYNNNGEEETLRNGLQNINFESMISHLVSLDGVIDALHMMHEKKEDYCKVMIDLRKKH